MGRTYVSGSAIRVGTFLDSWNSVFLFWASNMRENKKIETEKGFSPFILSFFLGLLCQKVQTLADASQCRGVEDPRNFEARAVGEHF